MKDSFICYSHRAEFIFNKKDFLSEIGLNPDAFYEIVNVKDDGDTLTFTMTVKSQNEFFQEES